MSRFQSGYTPTDGVTQSLLGDWADCRQRTQYSLDGWQKVGTDKSALTFGSRWAKVTQIMYESIRQYGRWNIGMALMPIRRWEFHANTEADQVLLAKLRALVEPYCRMYPEDLTRKWIGVETVFDQWALWPGFRWRRRGRFDGFYRDQEGRAWLLETKTKGRIDLEQINLALAFDRQVLFYLSALEQLLGERVAGVTYNIVRRSTHKLGPKESVEEHGARVAADIEKRPEHYFIRNQAYCGPEVLDEYKAELKATLKEFRAWCRGTRATYRNHQSCFTPWTCEFVEACASGTMNGYQRTKVLFEELKED